MILSPTVIYRLFTALATCLALSVAGTAFAVDDKKAAKAQQERIQRMQQAQQVLVQEKSQLNAEKSDMELQLGTVKTELEKARSSARREAVELRELKKDRAEKDALVGRLAEIQRELIESRQKLQDSAVAGVLDRKATLAAQREADQSSKNLISCEAQNQGLYKLNTNLLLQYERAFNYGGFLGSGFLTQLEGVRFENEVAGYRDQLDELKLSPSRSRNIDVLTN